MATNHSEAELRRYLLGELSETQATTLEQDYFGREDLVDRMRAAESDLVDDYVEGRLSRPEIDRFDQHYLATPVHRHRLAVARELRAASQAAAPGRAPSDARAWSSRVNESRVHWRPSMTALAASLLLLAGGAAWMVRTHSIPTPSVVTSSPVTTPSRDATATPPSVTPQAPRNPGAPGSSPLGPVTVTLALSPLSVRAADESPVLRMTSNTELAVLHLEGDAAARGAPGDTAVIRTISGRMIWRGPATVVGEAPGERVSIEIPARTLPPDDYFVALFETDRDGREAERYRYFLRVRHD